MRRGWLFVLAVALLLSSAALGWMSWERGEAELFFFLIFPVLKAEGAYGAASLILAFAAFLVITLSFFTMVPREGTGRSSVGGVVMIGPLPIVLGNDRRTVFLALVIALVVLMIILFLVQ